ncbi:hypothetical protein GMRT_15843 [Giardia muris]|uniref:Uncharacterized protein n=1 Tax=Giardia muris TaxID=5742 RepID=A0A4Z1T210_GIAMU|nr:hypothetical protein GMRT_15843 [Giardia muris]|eukprot:TNJ26609.1 hypothetical protein GMRT_15843 [Giardia muris]
MSAIPSPLIEPYDDFSGTRYYELSDRLLKSVVQAKRALSRRDFNTLHSSAFQCFEGNPSRGVSVSRHRGRSPMVRFGTPTTREPGQYSKRVRDTNTVSSPLLSHSSRACFDTPSLSNSAMGKGQLQSPSLPSVLVSPLRARNTLLCSADSVMDRVARQDQDEIGRSRTLRAQNPREKLPR